MKIAIIGGTSFIGQTLLTYLLKKKDKIIATYNNNTKIKKKFLKVKWKKLDFKSKKKKFL